MPTAGGLASRAPQVLIQLPVGFELGAGSGIGPEDGGPQGQAPFVREDHAVHLAREPERRDLPTAPAHRRFGRLQNGVPPLLRERTRPIPAAAPAQGKGQNPLPRRRRSPP